MKISCDENFKFTNSLSAIVYLPFDTFFKFIYISLSIQAYLVFYFFFLYLYSFHIMLFSAVLCLLSVVETSYTESSLFHPIHLGNIIIILLPTIVTGRASPPEGHPGIWPCVTPALMSQVTWTGAETGPGRAMDETGDAVAFQGSLTTSTSRDWGQGARPVPYCPPLLMDAVGEIFRNYSRNVCHAIFFV